MLEWMEKNSHWMHIHEYIENQRKLYCIFTADDFKLTCTTTNVKRGIVVPLLSERVQGKCFRIDKRFFLKMACPLKARRWTAEYKDTTDTHGQFYTSSQLHVFILSLSQLFVYTFSICYFYWLELWHVIIFHGAIQPITTKWRHKISPWARIKPITLCEANTASMSSNNSDVKYLLLACVH